MFPWEVSTGPEYDNLKPSIGLPTIVHVEQRLDPMEKRSRNGVGSVRSRCPDSMSPETVASITWDV